MGTGIRARSLVLLSSALLAACGGGGAVNPAPVVQLLLPQPALVAPGEMVTIRYVDDDPGEDALTEIFADADGDPATTEDRILIAQALPDGDGAVQSVVWDTKGVPSGTYTIFAITIDSANAPAEAQDILIINAPPTVSIDAPPLDETMAGTPLRLSYRDEDIDDEAETSLFAESTTGGLRFPIALARQEQPGTTQEVDWDTSEIPDGTYLLVAEITDGVHDPVAATAPGTVTLRSTGIVVKDASGRGATSWPVTAVVPLERGRFQTTDLFRLIDAGGAPVPAQFEVLNRWWHGDGSLRHMLVHFNASVAADGEARYAVRLNPSGTAAPDQAVVVAESPSGIVVNTGALFFRVSKTGFNLFDEVHVGGQRIVSPGASEGPAFTGRLAGDLQRDADRQDLRFEVEEAGPLRAVIRVSAPTIFTDTTDHKHGFALRIYAYAGQPFVKVDYQLQNSATNVQFSWPLYFEDLSLHVKPDLVEPVVRLSPRAGQLWTGAPGSYLMQDSLTVATVRDASDDSVLQTAAISAGDSSFGWMDVSDASAGLAVMIRHMAEMWPNAVEVAADHDVAVRLWPRQGAQWHDKQLSATGLYWLEDMQQVVKETLFLFHGPGVPDADLEATAANFQYHPVAFVAPADYRRTAVTVDLEGLFPGPLPGPDTRRVAYASDWLDPANGHYAFGWMNFGGDTTRKRSSTAGDWPDSAAAIFASNRVDHWLEGERRMWGDLNVRPMWLDGYSHDDDFDLVHPTENPYGGESWRRFTGHGDPHLAAPYLAGTGFGGWTPRDNQHGWFYHIEEFYLASGNPWVRDWYRFIAEFRKRTLFQIGVEDTSDPFFEWLWNTRGEAHMLANALQAYRTTGDAQLLDGLRTRIDWLHEQRLDPQYGVIDPTSEGVFQNGFLARVLLDLYRELYDVDREHAAKAFLIAWGLVEWNYHIGRWAHFVDSTQDTSAEPSNGSALAMVDPVALFYRLSGRTDLRDDMFGYVDGGYNGGRGPYGGFPVWTGGWEGRAHEYVSDNPKPDETPPAAVADLAARLDGAEVLLDWTAPPGAERSLVVWSALPIERTFTTAAGARNFWAANLAGLTTDASLALPAQDLPAGATVYFALVPIDAAHNLGAVSNVASITLP